jgi:hypothetical protein
MKKIMLFIILLCPSFLLSAQSKPTDWNLVAGGDLTVGYHRIESPTLAGMESYGVGNLKLDGTSFNLCFGFGMYRPDFALVSLYFNMQTALGFMWSNVLGVAGFDFPMSVYATNIILEFELMYPLIPFIYPFIGVGYSNENEINDEYNTGFGDGPGLVLTAGIDIAPPRGISRIDDSVVIAPRIEIMYRPPFSYADFYFDGNAVSNDIGNFYSEVYGVGNPVPQSFTDFFSQTFDGEALSILIGVHVAVSLLSAP